MRTRFFYLWLISLCLGFTACSSTEDEGASSNGANNDPSKMIVTADYEIDTTSISFNYRNGTIEGMRMKLFGYANLSNEAMLLVGNSVDVGIEYGFSSNDKYDFNGGSKHETTRSFDTERKFEIAVSIQGYELNKNLKLFYRAFTRTGNVYNYGKTQSAQIPSIESLVKDIKVKTDTLTSAMIKEGNIRISYTGIMIAKNKSDLTKENIINKNESTKEIYLLKKSDLDSKVIGWKEFYYCAYAQLNDYVIMGNILSWTNNDEDSELELLEGGEFELPEGVLSLEDEYLRTLICAFTDEQPLELTADANWKKKSYQVTLGSVRDDSQSTVRLVEVGNLQNADQYVLDLIGSLGLNSDDPDGFSYENLGVKVKYEHNTVGDPNRLATIEIDMPKQLPDLTELRLVKTMPFNVGEEPYYHLGDIVKQNDQLYVCVSNHDYNETAIFLSFHQEHKKFPWPWQAHKANITFYNASDPMATNRALYNWVANILLDDTNYNSIISRLNATGYMDKANQVLPADANERLRLAQSLFSSANQAVEVGSDMNFIEPFTWQEDAKSGGSMVAPRERILCNNYRFAPKSGTTEFWVPYMMCVKESESSAVDKQIRAIESQYCAEFKTDHSLSFTNKYAALSDVSSYRIHTVAMHWALGNYAKGKWAVYDFTKNWSQKSSEDSKWLNSCVTSSAITFTDNGLARSGLSAVSMANY